MKLTAEEKKEFLAKLAVEANDHGFETKQYNYSSLNCVKKLANKKLFATFIISLTEYTPFSSNYSDHNDTYVILSNPSYYNLKKCKMYKFSCASLKKKTGYRDMSKYGSRTHLYFDVDSFSLSGVLAEFFKKVDEVCSGLMEEERKLNREKKLAEIRDDEITYTLEEVKNKLEEIFPGMNVEIKTSVIGYFYRITLYNFEIPQYLPKKVITLSQAEYKELGVENRFITDNVRYKDLPDTAETPLFSMYDRMCSGSLNLTPTKPYGEWGIDIKYDEEDKWVCELRDVCFEYDCRKICKPEKIVSWVDWVIRIEKKCYAAFKEYHKTIKTVVMESKK